MLEVDVQVYHKINCLSESSEDMDKINLGQRFLPLQIILAQSTDQYLGSRAYVFTFFQRLKVPP